MTILLEAKQATFRVRGRALVDAVSLTAEPGELIAIVGPNGAGKTTLLRLLTGEAACHGGGVLLEGADIRAMPAWSLAARRAVMAQAARLSFPFTLAEVVRLGIDGVGRRLPASRRQAIIDGALAAADVGALAGRLYQTLSGGEQQRAQFARALAQLEAARAITGRQILFLDEPVASLDLSHQLGLMQAAAREAARGAAVIAVLHDLNLAATFADRIVVIARSRLVAQGRPREVLSRALMSDVFGVDLPLSRPPPNDAPYILPQHYSAGRADAPSGLAPARF